MAATIKTCKALPTIGRRVVHDEAGGPRSPVRLQRLSSQSGVLSVENTASTRGVSASALLGAIVTNLNLDCPSCATGSKLRNGRVRLLMWLRSCRTSAAMVVRTFTRGESKDWRRTEADEYTPKQKLDDSRVNVPTQNLDHRYEARVLGPMVATHFLLQAELGSPVVDWRSRLTQSIKR